MHNNDHHRIMHIYFLTWINCTSDFCSEWRKSIPHDVAAIGGPCDLRMKPPSWERPKARNDYADWLRRATPITPAPITIGRLSTIWFHPEVMPLVVHIAGACNACLPYADTVCQLCPGILTFSVLYPVGVSLRSADRCRRSSSPVMTSSTM